MPLLKSWTYQKGKWAIWHVTESFDELRRMLTSCLPYDEELAQLGSSSRRMEYVAVRVLLKTIYGEELFIAHRPSGKPYLKNHSLNISISHTRGYVAVGLHPDHEPGIDIEYVAERVRKITSRFMRTDEQSALGSLSPDEELSQLLLHWSAKETIYKVMGCEGIDLQEHLRVLPFTLSEAGEFSAEEYFTPLARRFDISYSVNKDFVCTWCVAPRNSVM